MTQYFVPPDVKVDLWPLMEARAEEFGIKLEKLEGQLYGIHPQPLVDEVTGGYWSFEVGFCRDANLGNDFLRAAWFFDTKYNNSQDRLTAYCRQWGYPRTEAWNDDAQAQQAVGGFVRPEQRNFAQRWFKYKTGGK
jgi:hypothetical protein